MPNHHHVRLRKAVARLSETSHAAFQDMERSVLVVVGDDASVRPNPRNELRRLIREADDAREVITELVHLIVAFGEVECIAT